LKLKFALEESAKAALAHLRRTAGQSLSAEDREDSVSSREPRPLSGALGPGSLRRPSRSPAV
jgi:hypothetical protein